MKLSRCLCIAALALMVGCAPEFQYEVKPSADTLELSRNSVKFAASEALWLKADGMPPIEQARQEGTIAYHIRSGRHEVMPYDWEQYVKFADKYLK